jgi:hypothetical protein
MDKRIGVRHIVAILGIIGFAALMALRSEISNITARSAVAAFAFMLGAISLIYFIKSRR